MHLDVLYGSHGVRAERCATSPVQGSAMHGIAWDCVDKEAIQGQPEYGERFMGLTAEPMPSGKLPCWMG